VEERGKSGWETKIFLRGKREESKIGIIYTPDLSIYT